MNQLHTILVVLCISLTLMLHIVSCLKKDINTDMSALLTLKSQLTIPNNNILETNWSSSSSESVCSWIGITCTARHRRVTSLDLSSMGLGGVLPPHIGNLSFLTYLSLYNNSFHGSIPSELFLLRRLEYADLGNNQFTGHIPSNLFLAPSLRTVSLESNSLTGSILNDVVFNNTGISSLRVLYLTDNKLTGEIPAEIFDHLPHLHMFSVTGNMLTGRIPTSLFRCGFLEILSLSFNELEGSIPPEIGNLTVLTELYLNDNKLTGGIPSELVGLINFEYLNLANNALTGEIPSSITNLTKLIQLNLHSNNLTGQIPQQFGNHLQSLQYLIISDNYLSGSLPLSIFNISSLIIIDFSSNLFSGSLPPSVGMINLPNLQQLFVSINFLNGTIPASISNLSNLISLGMSENQFSGPIPNELGSLRQLQRATFASNDLTLISSPSFFTSMASCISLTHLVLASNPLNTFIPSSIGNLSATLEYLYLERCQLKGTIPPQVGNLTSLILLSLQSNNLSGAIPDTVGSLQNIQVLSLRKNRIEGPIPNEFCKLSSSAYIYFQENKLSGSIPTCVGDLTSIKEMNMSSNRLSMEIPPSLWDLRNMMSLDLSGNFLSGHLPKEIQNLKATTWISFADNRFIDNIPSTFGDLIFLQSLSLANNKLEDPIPNSFGNLKSLEYLDLSRNNLSGVIPKSLEKLTDLEYFNVSVNRLEGEIPDGGPFTNLSAGSFILNGGLCGSARFAVPSCKNVAPSKNTKSFISLIRKYVIPTIGVALIIMFGLLVLVLILVRRRKMISAVDNATEMVPTATWRRVSYHELVQATNQFNESNLLGEGAFGSVFKGTLSDGLDIAIKVFKQNMEEAFESFHNECEVMRSIRHMNLVKVITSCSSPDLKCLIMEYMSNGSLEQWLYDTDNLNILQRLSIVIDVAKALEYLHHGHSVPVIHCDLKPSNVLLDEDMVAHVTDFGISKLLTGGNSITQTLTLATFGYTAPEYGLEGIVSTQGDVYSYGIMLMETFSGKRPTDEMFADGVNLPQWVNESLPHNVLDIAYFGLLNIEDQHFEKKKACIYEIMELALRCCSQKREDRPNITEISTKLKKMHAKLLRDPRFIP